MKRIPKIIEIVNLSEKRILEPSNKKGRVPLIEQIIKLNESIQKASRTRDVIPLIDSISI